MNLPATQSTWEYLVSSVVVNGRAIGVTGGGFSRPSWTSDLPWGQRSRGALFLCYHWLLYVFEHVHSSLVSNWMSAKNIQYHFLKDNFHIKYAVEICSLYTGFMLIIWKFMYASLWQKLPHVSYGNIKAKQSTERLKALQLDRATTWFFTSILF